MHALQATQCRVVKFFYTMLLNTYLQDAPRVSCMRDGRMRSLFVTAQHAKNAKKTEDNIFCCNEMFSSSCFAFMRAVKILCIRRARRVRRARRIREFLEAA